MKLTTKDLAVAALVAAAYASLTILLAPISYGPAQFRIAEALCVLPFFMPAATLGLFTGCAIANLMSTAGMLDIVFGSLATLLTALCIQRLGKHTRDTGEMPGFGVSALACLMPSVFNGPIIGAVLALTLTPGGAFWVTFAAIGLQIAIEEAGVMFLLGLPLMQLVPRFKHIVIQ